MLDKIPTRIWALLVLLAWGGAILYFGLVRLTPYGLDEGAALALLLDWSVSDMIANPVITFGGPDFRALLFAPLGMYWPGSMLAAKVFTLITTFVALMLLYRWTREHGNESDDETALIATGLMLVAPVTIAQADAIGSGPFLLLLFALGWRMDAHYRASPHSISSLYFLQLILAAITITLHPMGLAYPLALAWRWYRDPKSAAQQKQVWIGLGITTVIIIAMRIGWVALDWFANPLASLSQAVTSFVPLDPREQPGILPGLLLAALLLVLLAKDVRRLLDDLLGTSLLLALVVGLLAADTSWAMIALAVLLYRGIPYLILLNQRLGARVGLSGFAGQRGLVMAVVFVTATLFMQVDKAYANLIASGQLSPSDELIQTLCVEAADPDARFLAASQWPARTMIACRRDVLPLPPVAENGAAQLAMMHGVTHVIFDPNDPRHSNLARNFAEITGQTKTLGILPGGVLVLISPAETAPTAPPPAPPVTGEEPSLPPPETAQ